MRERMGRARGSGAPTGPGGAGGTTATGAASAEGASPPEGLGSAVTLPRGGGSLRGMGEKFGVGPVTGTSGLTVPLPLSPGRSGFGPRLQLTYDSGGGASPFGLGWRLAPAAVTRRTDRGVPRYATAPEDVFLLSDVEDLVPWADPDRPTRRAASVERVVDGTTYRVDRYRPRAEGLFARIERWTGPEPGSTHWRTLTREGAVHHYGTGPESRVADPADPDRVSGWLLCTSRDGNGNVVAYDYVPEDGTGVDRDSPHERNRTDADRSANRYLKRVRYGNLRSDLLPGDPWQDGWLFELVLDYGDHDDVDPRPAPDRPWTCRRDPFSTRRPGFEVRTYRLCRRVLMFHHLPDEPGVGADCLVKALELGYAGPDGEVVDDGHPVTTLLRSVVDRRYRRTLDGDLISRALPPLELDYSRAVPDAVVHEVDPASVADLPGGLGGSRVHWVDLDGDGMAGMLVQSTGGWLYKRNLGEGRFGPARLVTTQPTVAGAPQPVRFLDLAGDGRLDVVTLGPGPVGFHERADGGWSAFRAFRSVPTVPWDDPSARFVDLSGDGLADILTDAGDALAWYRSAGEAGYDGPERTAWAVHEERGPRVALVEPPEQQTLHLADMTGDGLPDLVRVGPREVCYWPSLGHGRFGPKVTMTGAPVLDEPDRFDPRRVRLADVDGSGTTDLLYLHRGGAQLHANQAGNGWGPAVDLGGSFPRADRLAHVETTDLLGTGTACLVWSSPLPSEHGRSVRYLDLMGGTKPYLLTSGVNNLGTRTDLAYAPSTRFALADEAAGRPWAARLPFPVHVVTDVTTTDLVSHNRFTTRYAYHHGTFDGVEREFRGFALVEQWDTAELEALVPGTTSGGVTGPEAVIGPEPEPETAEERASHVPPVLTRSWYHTGVAPDGDRLARRLAREYAREPGDAEATVLPGSVPPTSLRLPGRRVPWRPGTEEQRQVTRALKGGLLRREVYALDGTEAQTRPYVVSERTYTVELLQPVLEDGGDAVLLTHERESVDLTYERRLVSTPEGPRADPRVGHTLLLAVDDFGSPVRTAVVSYGRRHADPALPPEDRAVQARTVLTVEDREYTNAVDLPDAHRIAEACRSTTWEVAGARPAARVLAFDEVATMLAGLDDGHADVPAQEWDLGDPDRPVRRLTSRVRARRRRDDLTGPLPVGVLEPLGLPYDSQQLALTHPMVTWAWGGRVTAAELADAGYLADEEGWWVPSGTSSFSPDPDDGPDAELAHARRHFFLVRRSRDPLGHESTVRHDRYDLLVEETCDPVGNRSTAGERDRDGRLVRSGLDYRVLAPWLLTDPNRNRSVVAFDVLGLVAATAVVGKAGQLLGDSLDGLDPDLDDARLRAALADPLAAAHDLLGTATTRVLHDVDAFWRTRADPQPQPLTSCTLMRETHVADVPAGQRSRVQVDLTYTDGSGRAVQRKIQAEPGASDGSDGPDGPPRWVGSGWVVHDDKGRPVRRFEPFFSPTHRFEFDLRVGVGPTTCYDPLGRPLVVLLPDGTWTKSTHDPWCQESWAADDTVLLDPRTDPDVAGFVARTLEAQPGWRSWYAQRADGALGERERQAARQSAAHAGTPTRVWGDVLARPFVAVADAGPAADGTPRLHRTRMRLDVTGTAREVVDALGRTVLREDIDLLQVTTSVASMDAGRRWSQTDVLGDPALSWDDRGRRVRSEHDGAGRPVATWLRTDDGPEQLVGRVAYGEQLPDAEERNLRTQAVRSEDQAGARVDEAFDVKGGLLASTRWLAVEYARTLDWSGDVPLEAAEHRSAATYDALNRAVRTQLPDGTSVRSTYSVANLLESVAVQIGPDDERVVVAATEHDAHGRRTQVVLGNGVRTTYEYDAESFRLRRLRTWRRGRRLQDLEYTYDAAGNVTHVRDRVRRDVFFRNRRVSADASYVYDALHRLVRATGRELLGLQETAPAPGRRSPVLHPGDANAVARYVEHYEHDAVGNLLGIRHRGEDSAHAGWARQHVYAEPSLLEPARAGDRLSTSTVDGRRPRVERYTYDAHGSTTTMPHLASLEWDHLNRLVRTSRQEVHEGTGERTWYVYDADGDRVRKVTEHQAEPGVTPRRAAERTYLGVWETYRRYDGDDVALERVTVHVNDDERRVALLERRTVGVDRGPDALDRYLLTDHLGSTTLELDGRARLLAHEELHPYGTTAYRALRRGTEAPNRYRYTGRERDEESGMDHHGARYYAPWLGRWVSCDPAGLVDGTCLYQYCRSNPVNLHDPGGMQPSQPPLPGLFDPKVGGLWERAVVETLGKRFKATTYKEVITAYQAELQKRISAKGMGSNRKAGTGINYARETYSEVRTAFGKLAKSNGLDLTGIQVHHTLDELAKNPAAALDTTNLGAQTGHAGTKGSGHWFAHEANKAAEAGSKNPGLDVRKNAASQGIKLNNPALGPSPDVPHAPQVHQPHLSHPPSGRGLHAPKTPKLKGRGIIGVVIAGGVLLATGDAYAAAQTLNPAASTTDAVVNDKSGFEVGVGVAKDVVSLFPPAGIALFVWDVGQPQGEFMYDEELKDRAIAEGRNPFCAQCHGPGGALDPNNKWNRAQEQKRFDSFRAFGEITDADRTAIEDYIRSLDQQKQ